MINDLREGTFYANLYLERGKDKVRVDCRPSDAIALATATGTPIFVEEHVLDQVGSTEDEEDSL